MSNILLRAITGTIFIAVILGSIWLGLSTSIVIISSITILSLNEYIDLFKSSGVSINKPLALTFGISIFGILLTQFVITPSFLNLNLTVLTFPLVFGYLLTELYRKKTNPLTNIGITFIGFIYIFTPFILTLLILKNEIDAQYLLMGMFILIWTNDTFAYLSGRFFGKTKLFERISPKKTWEGTIGGILFTVIAAIILSQFSDARYSPVFWVVSALIIAPCAIFGDLFESLIKRSLNVKDSGTILPGHGGLLDRFDAALFTVPFFFTWMIIYSQI